MQKPNLSTIRHIMNSDPSVTADQYEAVIEILKGKRAAVKSPYYTLQEVAILTKWQPETVCRKAKEGKLPFITLDGGHRKFPREEIDAKLKTGF